MDSLQKTFRMVAVTSLLALSLPYIGGCASSPTKDSTGEYIDDSVITTKVKAALVRDDLTPAGAIKVETFKGTVQLSGFENNITIKQ